MSKSPPWAQLLYRLVLHDKGSRVCKQAPPMGW